MDITLVPVITIDGPSGTGKGTITMLLAKALGWHVLDSGAIYRAVAWAVLNAGLTLDAEFELRQLVENLTIQLRSESPTEPVKVYCEDADITAAIRQEQVGMLASKISALPFVRQAVLQTQRDFRTPPGLIADGRDMGTVVFPDANLKIYLDADPAVRTRRRYKQLHQRNPTLQLADIEADLLRRDEQDLKREIAPLKPAVDAYRIDTTHLSVAEVFAKVMAYVHEFVL